MWTLIEEIVGAVAVPEIVELPRLLSGLAAHYGFAIDQHFDGSQVASKIAGIAVGLHELRRAEGKIVLGGVRPFMPQPVLQLEKRHRILGCEEL